MNSMKFSNGKSHELDENGNGITYLIPDQVKNGKGSRNGNGVLSDYHNGTRYTESPLSQQANVANQYTFETFSEIAQYIKDRIVTVPKIAIICGSGLGSLANNLTEKSNFPYDEIPHFPTSTVAGHAGNLVIGKMNKVPVICMQGRFHYYEGYPLWKCGMPVRVFKLLGVETLIVTNAAGGLNPNYKVGDIMIIKDHVNFPGLAGESFLRGPNDERFGPRFLAMNKAYDRDLRTIAKSISGELELADVVHEGVYSMLGGPTFETVAELRLMKLLGIDAVGMSTVPEVIAAHHCGIKCFGFSLITNECVTSYDTDDQPDSDEVIETARQKEGDLIRFVSAFVNALQTS